jgi:tryptophan synthase alpha chain
LRRFTELPIAVGFGVSTAEQVSEVWRHADAAVVGSRIVSEIESSIGKPDLVRAVGAVASQLAGARTAASD